MSEKELNEQYIRNKLQGICQDCMWFDKTIPVINKMLREAYISGFEQDKFDTKMDLQQEIDRLNNIINELESYLLDYDESKVIISSKGVYYKNIDILDKLKELKEDNK